MWRYNHFPSSQPKHEHRWLGQHGFEGGPEHSHQSHKFQAARNCTLDWSVRRLRSRHLPDVCADDRAPEKFSCARCGDIRKHAWILSSVMNPFPEILDLRSDHRERQESISVNFELMESMKASAPAVNTMVFAEYMIAGPATCVLHSGRWWRGHDVAGSRALVKGVRRLSKCLNRSLRRSNSISARLR